MSLNERAGASWPPTLGQPATRSVDGGPGAAVLQGAKWGSQRRQILSDARPRTPVSVQLNSLSGHTRRLLAMVKVCLISSGSRVRILPGAPIKQAGQRLARPGGSRSSRGIPALPRPVACPMEPSLAAACSPPRAGLGHRRLPAGAHRLRAGRPLRPGLSSAPFGPSARAGLLHDPVTTP